MTKVLAPKRARSRIAAMVASCLALTGCAVGPVPTRSGTPLPPSRPLSVDAFEVRFTPAGPQTYPPTAAAESRPYRVVLHLGSGSPQVRRDERPPRPHVTIGTLRFGENWYADTNLDELIERHVRAVGGDAVATWTIYQRAVAYFPDVGSLYYARYEAQVIRYTDR